MAIGSPFSPGMLQALLAKQQNAKSRNLQAAMAERQAMMQRAQMEQQNNQFNAQMQSRHQLADQQDQLQRDQLQMRYGDEQGGGMSAMEKFRAGLMEREFEAGAAKREADTGAAQALADWRKQQVAASQALTPEKIAEGESKRKKREAETTRINQRIEEANVLYQFLEPRQQLELRRLVHDRELDDATFQLRIDEIAAGIDATRAGTDATRAGIGLTQARTKATLAGIEDQRARTELARLDQSYKSAKSEDARVAAARMYIVKIAEFLNKESQWTPGNTAKKLGLENELKSIILGLVGKHGGEEGPLKREYRAAFPGVPSDPDSSADLKSGMGAFLPGQG